MSHKDRFAVLALAVALLVAVVIAEYVSFAIALVVAPLIAIACPALFLDRSIPEPEPDEQDEMPAAVLDGISDAVILLDEKRNVVAANRAARELLEEPLEGRDLALSLRHPEALEAANEAISGGTKHSAEIVMRVPVQRVFLVHVAPLPEATAAEPRFLVVLHEVTASRTAEQIRADLGLVVIVSTTTATNNRKKSTTTTNINQTTKTFTTTTKTPQLRGADGRGVFGKPFWQGGELRG